MKSLAFGTLIGLGLALVSCEKKSDPASPSAELSAGNGYVLARKISLPAPGKTWTKETVVSIPAGTMQISASGQEMDGSMSSKDTRTESMEAISETKARHLVTGETNEGKMIVAGQEQPVPRQPNALLKIPVIVEFSDGKWSATLEAGEPTAEQEKALAKLAKQCSDNNDLAMYGDTPRKPGDQWDADPSTLSSFGDAESLEGSFRVEFVEVKEYDGVKCAVLKSVFDLAGRGPEEEDAPEMTMKMKGEAVSYRSLTDLVDLNTEITASLIIEIEPAPGVSMKIDGPMTMTQKIGVK